MRLEMVDVFLFTADNTDIRIGEAISASPSLRAWRVRENQMAGKVIIDKKENAGLCEQQAGRYCVKAGFMMPDDLESMRKYLLINKIVSL